MVNIPPGLYITGIMPHVDLLDDEAAARVALSTRRIDGDCYTGSSGIATLKTILAKLTSQPAREPLLPPSKMYAPPRATAARRR